MRRKGKGIGLAIVGAGRFGLGLPTQAATAAEAHSRLMLTKALDLSAARRQPVKLPLAPEEERAVA